jgi:RNA polymerase primary sigma factor
MALSQFIAEDSALGDKPASEKLKKLKAEEGGRCIPQAGTSETAGLFEEIFRTPLLTPKEEKNLFNKLKANPKDKVARNRIIEANLRLVLYWARKISQIYLGTSLTLSDLFQEGTFGLMHAVDIFQSAKGVRFSTLASWWIRQRIWREIHNNGQTIRVPVNVHERERSFLRAQQKIMNDLGRYPTAKEIAEEMAISLDKIAKIQRAIALSRTQSLDEPFIEGGACSLLEILPAKDYPTTEEEADLLLREDVIKEALGFIKYARHRKVLELRFGIGDEMPRTLEEIGRRFGVTRERIRQIEAKALKTLQQNPQARQRLKVFYDQL